MVSLNSYFHFLRLKSARSTCREGLSRYKPLYPAENKGNSTNSFANKSHITVSAKLSHKPDRVKYKLQSECKDVVVWGSNLTISPGERLTRIQPSMVKLPVWGGVSCVMVGTLLSDA
jgi:hypothetical protein